MRQYIERQSQYTVVGLNDDDDDIERMANASPSSPLLAVSGNIWPVKRSLSHLAIAYVVYRVSILVYNSLGMRQR